MVSLNNFFKKMPVIFQNTDFPLKFQTFSHLAAQLPWALLETQCSVGVPENEGMGSDELLS